MKTAGGIILAAYILFGCVPKQQPATESPGQQSSGVTAGGQGGGATCESACSKLRQCGLASADCEEACHREGQTQDFLASVERSTCEEISAATGGGGSSGGGSSGGSSGGYHGSGASCGGNLGGCSGIGDICCAPGGGAAGYGQQGVCQQASICNGPRR